MVNKKEKKRKMRPEPIPSTPTSEASTEWKKMKKDPLKMKSMLLSKWIISLILSADMCMSGVWC